MEKLRRQRGGGIALSSKGIALSTSLALFLSFACPSHALRQTQREHPSSLGGLEGKLREASEPAGRESGREGNRADEARRLAETLADQLMDPEALERLWDRPGELSPEERLALLHADPDGLQRWLWASLSTFPHLQKLLRRSGGKEKFRQAVDQAAQRLRDLIPRWVAGEFSEEVQAQWTIERKIREELKRLGLPRFGPQERRRMASALVGGDFMGNDPRTGQPYLTEAVAPQSLGRLHARLFADEVAVRRLLAQHPQFLTLDHEARGAAARRFRTILRPRGPDQMRSRLEREILEFIEETLAGKPRPPEGAAPIAARASEQTPAVSLAERGRGRVRRWAQRLLYAWTGLSSVLGLKAQEPVELEAVKTNEQEIEQLRRIEREIQRLQAEMHEPAARVNRWRDEMNPVTNAVARQMGASGDPISETQALLDKLALLPDATAASRAEAVKAFEACQAANEMERPQAIENYRKAVQEWIRTAREELTVHRKHLKEFAEQERRRPIPWAPDRPTSFNIMNSKAQADVATAVAEVDRRKLELFEQLYEALARLGADLPIPNAVLPAGGVSVFPEMLTPPDLPGQAALSQEEREALWKEVLRLSDGMLELEQERLEAEITFREAEFSWVALMQYLLPPVEWTFQGESYSVPPVMPAKWNSVCHFRTQAILLRARRIRLEAQRALLLAQFGGLGDFQKNTATFRALMQSEAFGRVTRERPLDRVLEQLTDSEKEDLRRFVMGKAVEDLQRAIRDELDASLVVSAGWEGSAGWQSFGPARARELLDRLGVAQEWDVLEGYKLLVRLGHLDPEAARELLQRVEQLLQDKGLPEVRKSKFDFGPPEAGKAPRWLQGTVELRIDSVRTALEARRQFGGSVTDEGLDQRELLETYARAQVENLVDSREAAEHLLALGLSIAAPLDAAAEPGQVALAVPPPYPDMPAGRGSDRDYSYWGMRSLEFVMTELPTRVWIGEEIYHRQDVIVLLNPTSKEFYEEILVDPRRNIVRPWEFLRRSSPGTGTWSIEKLLPVPYIGVKDPPTAEQMAHHLNEFREIHIRGMNRQLGCLRALVNVTQREVERVEATKRLYPPTSSPLSEMEAVTLPRKRIALHQKRIERLTIEREIEKNWQDGRRTANLAWERRRVLLEEHRLAYELARGERDFAEAVVQGDKAANEQFARSVSQEEMLEHQADLGRADNHLRQVELQQEWVDWHIKRGLPIPPSDAQLAGAPATLDKIQKEWVDPVGSVYGAGLVGSMRVREGGEWVLRPLIREGWMNVAGYPEPDLAADRWVADPKLVRTVYGGWVLADRPLMICGDLGGTVGWVQVASQIPWPLHPPKRGASFWVEAAEGAYTVDPRPTPMGRLAENPEMAVAAHSVEQLIVLRRLDGSLVTEKLPVGVMIRLVPTDPEDPGDPWRLLVEQGKPLPLRPESGQVYGTFYPGGFRALGPEVERKYGKVLVGADGAVLRLRSAVLPEVQTADGARSYEVGIVFKEETGKWDVEFYKLTPKEAEERRKAAPPEAGLPASKGTKVPAAQETPGTEVLFFHQPETVRWAAPIAVGGSPVAVVVQTSEEAALLRRQFDAAGVNPSRCAVEPLDRHGGDLASAAVALKAQLSARGIPENTLILVPREAGEAPAMMGFLGLYDDRFPGSSDAAPARGEQSPESVLADLWGFLEVGPEGRPAAWEELRRQLHRRLGERAAVERAVQELEQERERAEHENISYPKTIYRAGALPISTEEKVQILQADVAKAWIRLERLDRLQGLHNRLTERMGSPRTAQAEAALSAEVRAAIRDLLEMESRLLDAEIRLWSWRHAAVKGTMEADHARRAVLSATVARLQAEEKVERALGHWVTAADPAAQEKARVEVGGAVEGFARAVQASEEASFAEKHSYYMAVKKAIHKETGPLPSGASAFLAAVTAEHRARKAAMDALGIPEHRAQEVANRAWLEAVLARNRANRAASSAESVAHQRVSGGALSLPEEALLRPEDVDSLVQDDQEFSRARLESRAVDLAQVVREKLFDHRQQTVGFKNDAPGDVKSFDDSVQEVRAACALVAQIGALMAEQGISGSRLEDRANLVDVLERVQEALQQSQAAFTNQDLAKYGREVRAMGERVKGGQKALDEARARFDKAAAEYQEKGGGIALGTAEHKAAYAAQEAYNTLLEEIETYPWRHHRYQTLVESVEAQKQLADLLRRLLAEMRGKGAVSGEAAQSRRVAWMQEMDALERAHVEKRLKELETYWVPQMARLRRIYTETDVAQRRAEAELLKVRLAELIALEGRPSGPEAARAHQPDPGSARSTPTGQRARLLGKVRLYRDGKWEERALFSPGWTYGPRSSADLASAEARSLEMDGRDPWPYEEGRRRVQADQMKGACELASTPIPLGYREVQGKRMGMVLQYLQGTREMPGPDGKVREETVPLGAQVRYLPEAEYGKHMGSMERLPSRVEGEVDGGVYLSGYWTSGPRGEVVYGTPDPRGQLLPPVMAPEGPRHCAMVSVYDEEAGEWTPALVGISPEAAQGWANLRPDPSPETASEKPRADAGMAPPQPAPKALPSPQRPRGMHRTDQQGLNLYMGSLVPELPKDQQPVFSLPPRGQVDTGGKVVWDKNRKIIRAEMVVVSRNGPMEVRVDGRRWRAERDAALRLRLDSVTGDTAVFEGAGVRPLQAAVRIPVIPFEKAVPLPAAQVAVLSPEGARKVGLPDRLVGSIARVGNVYLMVLPESSGEERGQWSDRLTDLLWALREKEGMAAVITATEYGERDDPAFDSFRWVATRGYLDVARERVSLTGLGYDGRGLLGQVLTTLGRIAEHEISEHDLRGLMLDLQA